MAGMNAGTLSIEIVAEIARLQEDMRRVQQSVGRMSSEVGRSTQAVNDNFRAVGRSSEQAAQDIAAYGRQLDQLRAKYNPQFAAISQYKQALVEIRQAHKVGAISADEMAAAISRQRQATLSGLAAHRTAGGGIVQMAGQQRAGMQQLSMQLNDVATMYALGAKPMQIFASQAGQVMQAVQLMSGGTSRLAAFLGGPWGLALTTAAIVLTPFIAQLFETKDAAEETKSALETVLDKWRDFQKERFLIQNATAGLAPLLKQREALATFVGKLEAGIANGTANRNAPRLLKARREELAEINKQIFDNRNAIDFERSSRLGGIDQFLVPDKPTKERMPRAPKVSDAERAMIKQTKASDSFIGSLEEEIAKIGLDEKAIRQLEIARQLEAATTDKQRGKINELNKAREAALAVQAAVEAAKDTQSMRDANLQLDRELELVGLVGAERERLAAAIKLDNEVRALGVKITEAETAGNAALADELRQQVSLLYDRFGIQVKSIGLEEQFEKDRDSAERLNAELDRMIGLLGGLGGFGQALGGLLGLFSGNISSIGGPFGDLLNMATGGTKIDVSGKEVARTIGDELRGIFKMEGEFGKTMSSILGGAGTGVMAAGAFGLAKDPGGKIGSAIGGALGKQLGTKVLGKALGAAAGPIGSIVGGLLGGLVGGMLKKAKWGSATIGGVNGALGITGTRGNNASRTAAATKSANAVIDSLEGLAEQLNAGIDASRGSVSLGVRKKSYRVDPSGRGATKVSRGAVDFGEDAEAAAEFAMLDLIKDGVLTGLRKGTEMLLQGSDDLQAAVTKALKFENVFKELAQRTSPLEFALTELTREFDRLRKIFDKAGASAQDYAALEQLLAIRRQEAVDDIGRRAIDDLSDQNALQVEMLRLLGREQDAVALARVHELAATKATLQPLTAMVYQLRDARDVIEQFEPLAAGLKAFKQELLGGGAGAGGFAAVAAQFRATAGSARIGDAGALGRLQADASAFLDAARENARSDLEYRRALGEVLAATDQGIFAAETQVDYAQLQIDAINNTSTILSDIKSQMATYQARIVEQGEWVERMFRRWEGEGMPIRSDAGNPIYTEVA